MNKRRHYLWAMLGSMILVGLTACSGDDDQTDKPDDGVKVRRMTITQTDGAAARQALTRATLTEDDGLSALWTAGDRLTYCNLSRTNPEDEVYSGPLTAVSTAATSPFTGEVTCRTGDYLAVVYPATTFETNESYTISLAGQDGTLGTLATKYHYVYGKAYVTSVTDNTADATMEKMKSLLTVCKFSFVDKTTGNAIAIRSLTIGYGGSGSDADTYPQEATVAVSPSTPMADIHATGATGGSKVLTVSLTAAQGAVYVALLPTNGQRTFRFTVTDDSGNTYSGTAKATLTEGDYVVATGLKLTKN
jgi:hypothetical protein